MKIYDIWLQLDNLAFCDSFQLVKGIKHSLISIPTDCSKRPYFSESSNWWANTVYFTTYEIYSNHYNSSYIIKNWILFTFHTNWTSNNYHYLICLEKVISEDPAMPQRSNITRSQNPQKEGLEVADSMRYGAYGFWK